MWATCRGVLLTRHTHTHTEIHLGQKRLRRFFQDKSPGCEPIGDTVRRWITRHESPWHWRMFPFPSNVVFLMRWKRELLCLMLCADLSLSSTTLRATAASSTTELPPIKPIRAWRETPLRRPGDGGRRREDRREKGRGSRSMEGRRGETRERRRNKKSLSHTPWCLSRTQGEFPRGTALVWRNFSTRFSILPTSP